MNEERSQDYLNLINALLNCPSGEEGQILNANQDLLDAGLLQAMAQVAEFLEKRGDRNAANFLIDVARHLAEVPSLSSLLRLSSSTPSSSRLSNSDSQLDFLLQVLLTTYISKGNPQVMYPLLQANLNKLDDNFAQVLQSWANATLPEVEPQQAYSLGAAIGQFSTLIWLQFPLGNRASNLEIAITGYDLVATVFTRNAFPLEWAIIQNNMGAAYCERIRGERAENLEAAILCYEAALKEYTRETFPQQWASIHNNLGNVYCDRIRYEKAENLEVAICCYLAALKECTCEAVPEEWAKIQNNLGTAYLSRIRGGKPENLEEAIRCFSAALKVRTRQACLQDWAQTQNNLGIAYHNRIRGEKPENLEEAIRCFSAALKVYTAFSQNWATVQNNLGTSYYETQKLEEAIDCFSAALKVRTRQAFPQDYVTTQFNLGRANQTARQFLKAYNAFADAIDTIESLREQIISGSGREEDKQKLAEEWNKLYQCMVEVCLELRDYNQALAYVERSKARNLVELFATRDLYPKGDIPETVFNELNRLRREIATEQRLIDITRRDDMGRGRMSDGHKFPTNSLAASGGTSSTRLNALRQQLDNLINQQIQPIDPTFSLTQRVEPISFQQIQELLHDNQTTLIEWYILGKTFLTFIVTSQSPGIAVWQSSPEDGQALKNWGEEYWQDYSDPDDPLKQYWKDKLESRLNRLAEILHLEKVLNHVPNSCDRVILIPHRFLHLFPLHALPLANGDYLCDRFPNGVSYAPSCQLLQLTQKRDRPDFNNLFAVQNPTDDLLYTNLEVEIIRSSFPSAQVLVKQEATKIAFNASLNLPLANCNHFSCHGEFNLKSPLESALILANEERLTLGEIFGLTLNQCRLVTLSACETGLTDPTSISDEYIGLPSGFLYAGSPSVVSSLWTVSDLSTAFLMLKFYENFQSSQKQAGDVAIALNQAQKWLRNLTTEEFEKLLNKYKPQIEQIFAQMPIKKERIKARRRLEALKRQSYPFASPFYWAAFTATGL